MDILVSEILSIEKFLLGENVIGRHGVVDIETAGAVRGDVYQTCAGLQTEVNTTLRTPHIHVFDLRAFAEVFHHRGAVEHRVDFHFNKTVAEEFVVGGFEIVEQEGFQPVLSDIQVLVAYQTVNVLRIRPDQFLQNVNAQVPLGTGEQHIAQRLALAFAETVQCVVVQQVVNVRIVEFGDIVIV